jgi:hypothetical protein
VTTIGHGGSLAGFRAELLRFPEQETTVLVLCNFPTSDPAGRARRVADVVMADHLEPVPEAEAEETPAAETGPVELTTEQLDAFVGHWRASMGVEVEIRREEDRLIFIQDGGRTPITVLADDRLRVGVADIDMTASRMTNGKYTFMRVTQRGQAFTAERFDPEAGVPDFATLVGEFYSEELDVTYGLFQGERGLMVRGPLGQEARVQVGDDDRIRAPFGTLVLQREGGQVVGFTLEAGRAGGMVFVKVVGGG